MDYKKIFGCFLIVIGVVLILESFVGITGFVVGGVGGVDFVSVLGFVFVVGGVGLMVATTLEQKTLGKIYSPRDENFPVILDTNYLIEATRDNNNKDGKDAYNGLLAKISEYKEESTLIVPKGVLSEFRAKGSPREKERVRDLKEVLDKDTLTLEVLREKWKMDSGLRKKYNEIAMGILEKTPKAIAYNFLTHIGKKGNLNFHAEDFLLFPSYKEFSYNKEFENVLEKAKREYNKSVGPKGKWEVMHGYKVSNEDVEILAPL
jgi:hypothetical protein